MATKAKSITINGKQCYVRRHCAVALGLDCLIDARVGVMVGWEGPHLAFPNEV